MRFEAAALQIDELAHECQPDAHPAVPSRDPRIALLKQLEDSWHEFGRYPLAVVLDVESRFLAVAIDAHGDSAARRCELDGVRQQVPCDLLDAHRIALDDQRLRRQ